MAGGERAALAAAAGLLAAALLPPSAFLLLPAALGALGPAPVAGTVAALLLLLPAATGLAAARWGLEGVARRFRGDGRGEHELALLRIPVAALLFAYACAMAVGDAAGSAGPCLAAASAALICGWLLLLWQLCRPAPSALRRHAAMALDAAAISAFVQFGEAATAAWYPLYLLASFHAGLRFGCRSLAVSAALNAIGFAAVLAAAPFWHRQVPLGLGLLAALLALPLCLALLLRALAKARASAAAVESARIRALDMIGGSLRAALETAAGRAAAPPAGQPDREDAEQAQELFARIGAILDLSAIGAGNFRPRSEGFDLHAAVNAIFSAAREEAERRGGGLVWRIDPRLPYRLRGWRQPFERILDTLVREAVAAAAGGPVQAVVGCLGIDESRVELRVAVRCPGRLPPLDAWQAAADPLAFDAAASGGAEAAADRGVLARALAGRLIGLMGGRLSGEPGPGRHSQLSLVLPLTIDATGGPAMLDLGNRPVLIATEDSRFAGCLVEPLAGWRADTRWIGGPEAALEYLSRFEPAARPILIVDGRDQALSALSFAHRVPAVAAEPPFILFVAGPEQIEGIDHFAEAHFDGLLPTPIDDDLLGTALHALPLQAAPRPVDAGEGPTPRREPPPDARDRDRAAERVTPITAHPRFAPDEAAIVDAAVIDALRRLEGGDDFLREVFESFRIEAGEIVAAMRRAGENGDGPGLIQSSKLLRGCAASVGGIKLCELLTTVERAAADRLRDSGAPLVQRVEAELDRLNAALAELLDGPRAQHRQ